MNFTIINMKKWRKKDRWNIIIKSKLNNKQIKDINSRLATIVLMREEICEIVNKDCLKCPLNVLDKCTELNLPEFNFEENQWLDTSYENKNEV